ncbi:MAG: hypothetical protein LBH25_09840 [Fibromonadaceae bacterium]|jgi:hypothetical protein|nr:hypothetical protein [Fibromonadaceae bacterium]
MAFKPACALSAFICFVLLTISISYADEQETTVEQNNTRVSVYLHPAYFLLFKPFGTIVYSTVEIPFSLSNSLITKPSLLYVNAIANELHALRLGSDIGFRHYPIGNGEGFYLQGQMGIFYYHSKYSIFPSNYFSDNDCDGDCTGSDTKFVWLDAMAYIGYSIKFSNVSVFADIGIGAFMKNAEIRYLTGLYDFNIGVGIPFGAGKPVNTQEWEPKQDNTRISVYLHPLLLSLCVLEKGNSALMLYSTIEIPLDLEQSLIVKPSFISSVEKLEIQLKVGNDIGVRTYYNKKGEGLYWQAQVGAFYSNINALSSESEIISSNPIWLDAMAYIGYSKKFSNVSVFADIGIGLGNLFGFEYDGYSQYSDLFPILDANFGIGIPF